MLHWWKNKKPAEHLQFWLELFTSLSEIYNVNNFIIIDFWHTVNSAFCRILSILVEAKKYQEKQKKVRLKRTFLHHDNHGKYGVGDGIRTHDLRDHNPTL